MIKYRIAILFISLLLSLSGLAKGQKTANGPKTLKSKLGFEITRPNCWTIQPNPAESSSKDLLTADVVDIRETNKCPDAPSRQVNEFYGAVIQIYRDYNPSERLLQAKQGLRHLMGAPVIYRKLSQLNGSPAVLICENLKDKYAWYVRWSVFLYCKKRAIWLNLLDNTNISDEKIKKIASDNFILPSDETQIFKSFRCDDNDK